MGGRKQSEVKARRHLLSSPNWSLPDNLGDREQSRRRISSAQQPYFFVRTQGAGQSRGDEISGQETWDNDV